MTRFLMIAMLVTLTACAGGTQATTGKPADLRIMRLEQMANKLRTDHTRMGHSLTALETEIARAKATPRTYERVANPAKTEAAVASIAPAEENSAGSPTLLGPDQRTAALPTPAVSGLTEQDLNVEPPKSIIVAPARGSTSPTPAATTAEGGKVYLMQVAAYLEADQVKAGWQQLKSAHPMSLQGLQPHVTTYTDARSRDWLRLSAGPFSTPALANSRCATFKEEGATCSVLAVDRGAARLLR